MEKGKKSGSGKNKEGGDIQSAILQTLAKLEHGNS